MTKVLVFESDAQFAQSLVSGLAAYGCATKVVEDGEAGIVEAEQNKPDLILLSIELPRMNGFSVCNKLKRSSGVKDVPLILLSSEATDETFEQHRRLRTHAEDYVHKPISVEQLVARIRPFVQLSAAEGAAAVEIDDVVIEEDLVDAADDVDAETEEAFGNLMGPPSKAPPPPSRIPPPPAAASATSAPSDLGELRLDESEGLKVAPDEEVVQIDSVEPPEIEEIEPLAAGPTGPSPELLAELEQLRGRVSSLERDLGTANEAAADLAGQKDQLAQKKEAELTLLQRELDELREKMASNQGGNAREFLDLREQLNKKEKEILDVRDQLTSREKEVVKLNDSNIGLEREKVELGERLRELENTRAALEKTRDALTDDKAQANKRADDFKSKSERLTEELETRTGELRTARETHENAMVQRDAETAALREDHKNQLREAADKAAEAQKLAVEQATLAESERGQAAREAALAAAATEAHAAQLAAIATREGELKSEQDAKLAALHRANEEALRKLKAEHQHLSEEAAQAAADRLAARERELLDEKTAAL
ncbi:MAG TPA: response regulator, partial [Polyangiaceae bacterium]|nr:response regulator [Polyangiaceae bacterium]